MPIHFRPTRKRTLTVQRKTVNDSAGTAASRPWFSLESERALGASQRLNQRDSAYTFVAHLGERY